MKLHHLIAALIPMVACPSFAHAEATATIEYLCAQEFTTPVWTKACLGGTVVKHRVTVAIAAEGADVGRPGSYYIGMRQDGNIKGLFDGRTWVGMEGGMLPTAGSTQRMSAAPVEFLVLSESTICALSGPGNLELWAGYGALTKEMEDRVEFFHKAANPNHTPEYMRQVYIQNDMRLGEKGWNVLKFSCQDPNNAGGYF